MFRFSFSLKPRHPTRPLFHSKLYNKKGQKREKESEKRESNIIRISIIHFFKEQPEISQGLIASSTVGCMDRREMIDGEGWTEERHAAFLNWMEESFVHRMLGPSSKEAAIGFCPSQQCSPAPARAPCHDLPLNRLIPDSATESTGDSRLRPSRLLVESGNTPRDLVVVTNTNRNRITKRLLSQLDAPHDQVVPQLGGAVDISKKKKKRR